MQRQLSRQQSNSPALSRQASSAGGAGALGLGASNRASGRSTPGTSSSKQHPGQLTQLRGHNKEAAALLAGASTIDLDHLEDTREFDEDGNPISGEEEDALYGNVNEEEEDNLPLYAREAMNDGCLVDEEGYGVDVKRRDKNRVAGLFKKGGRKVQYANSLAGSTSPTAKKQEANKKKLQKLSNSKSGNLLSVRPTASGTASGSAMTSATASATASDVGESGDITRESSTNNNNINTSV